MYFIDGLCQKLKTKMPKKIEFDTRLQNLLFC